MAATAVRRTLLVNGFVQGVGFRPFVYRLATEQLLGGWVRNDTAGVTISIEGPREAADRFVEQLHDRLPALARIDSCVVADEQALRDWGSRFEIRQSASDGETGALITPDGNVCADCLAELFDPGNRRHRYPLINCTNCGPRYSIIRGVPYDRPLTTMAPFIMCASCQAEYEDPGDRRFHAQPNACWDCGPRIRLLGPDAAPIEAADPVGSAGRMLEEGLILAVKALGGYHLMADPLRACSVATLRRRKKRDAKPFALLAKDVETVRRYAFCDADEARLLESPARPIVLLRARPGHALPPETAPGSNVLGFMLPATPLQHLLLESADVLIATSGNVSDEPMARTEAEAFAGLGTLADAFLVHDREIHLRVDDSVARVVHSGVRPKTTFIRRARGFAPDPIPVPFDLPPVLALGAELKNTVAVGLGRSLFVSQHIGDLQSPGNQAFLEQTVEHLSTVFGIAPELVAHDLHPDFFTTGYAKRCARLRTVAVQHHHAHMASCMADNGLTHPVIGVVFDGTGFGTDGTIWGGEFLIGDYRGFERAAHLGRFALPGGDRAVREPWRVALSLLTQHYGPDAKKLPLAVLDRRDPFELDVIARMVERGVHAPQASSMGRLFDAISALAGVCEQVSYEGQAAIELEQLLGNDHEPGRAWPVRIEHERERLIVDHGPWIRAAVEELTTGGCSAAEISRRFHESVVAAVTEVCTRLAARSSIRDVVLSGGVFLNQYLIVRVERELTDAGLRVHTHHRIPTTDGGISVGQALVAASRMAG